MNSLHREPPHETVKAALVRGDLNSALRVLAKLSRHELLETVLRCGFSMANSKSTNAIFAHLQPQIIKAARLKVDGFGLRDTPHDQDTEQVAIHTTPAREGEIAPLIAAARYLRDVAYNAHHLVNGHPTGLLFLATRMGHEFQVTQMMDRFGVSRDLARTLVQSATSFAPRRLNEAQTLKALTYFPGIRAIVQTARERVAQRDNTTLSTSPRLQSMESRNAFNSSSMGH